MKSAAVRVLVADDNSFDQLLLERTLKNAGYDVTLAGDGKQAVEFYRRSTPDIILLDMDMPVMDGLHTARHIRETCGDPRIPIIFMTGQDADDSTLASCLTAGGDDFLTKPIRPMVLTARLQSLLRSLQLYRELETRYHRLQQRYDELSIEEESARQTLDHLLAPRQPLPANLQLVGLPHALQHGRFFFSQLNSRRSQYILLGDLPCRSLNAGLCTLPLLEEFEKSIEANPGLAELLLKLDQTLWSRTPENVFVCLIAIRFEVDTGQLEVWNGGMPDVHLLDGKQDQPLQTGGLVLGINPLSEVREHIRQLKVHPGHRLLFYSDSIAGFGDAERPFNREQIQQLIREHAGRRDLLEILKQAWRAADDSLINEHPVALIELDCDPRALNKAACDNRLSPAHERA